MPVTYPPKPVHNSLYNLCLYKLTELCVDINREVKTDDLDKLVLDVSRKITPQTMPDEFDKIIQHYAINIVYGFTDEVPF